MVDVYHHTDNQGSKPMATAAISAGSKRKRASFAWGPAIAAFICLEGLVALQAYFAYEDHFFTVAQMQERGVNQGLPFFWHFGMWGISSLFRH